MAHAACVVSCIGVLLCAACGSTDARTLVRFQSGKAVGAWPLDASTDAELDAARADASTRDSGDADDAGELAPDAGAADEDAGETLETERDAAPPKVKPASACSFRLTTKSQGGRYSPKNIGAIWIEREDGQWVKTLAVWAGVRLRYLTTYLKANSTRNTMDAVTMATQRQHMSHEVKWNLKDGAGMPAPDGKYSVRVEVTDRDGMGQLLNVPFTKSSEPVEVSPADTSDFVEVHLSCS